MNFTKYQDILAQNLVASARSLKLGRKCIFQQDNNPIKIHKEMVNWPPNQHFAMAICIRTWKPVVWIEEGSPQAQTKDIKDLEKILYGGMV